MNILGISCFYHDSAACLVKDGKITAAAQEERFSRKKNDPGFPKKAIQYCLEEGKIGIDGIDYVGFYEKPFIKFERILLTYFSYSPRGVRSFIKAIPLWIKQRLWMSDLIRNELKFKGKIIFTGHHESHAASAFFASPFREAAILTMDAAGEWDTASYGTGNGNRLDILASQRFPHSLGLLYSAFTYYAGFKVNSAEYKVMGLAPYGEPEYVSRILSELVDLKDDGSFRLNMGYFNYAAGLTMTSGKFHRLFDGPPRKSGARLTQRDMDLARSIQMVTEEIILRTARHVHKETGKKRLCLAGGVALNCVANGRILRETPFEDIWIQPAAGDAGGALGAALFTWYTYLDNQRNVDGERDLQEGSLLGPGFTDHQIEEFLKANSVKYVKLNREDLLEKVSDLIARQKIIGWFEGRMEFGPRALGARTIIGDARSKIMQSEMNLKIKFRESFRPFAPSVLRERVSDYFDSDHDSPYMLLVDSVKECRRLRLSAEEESLSGIEKLNIVRSEIPAVTHVDYSARVQTVTREQNPLYYDLIKRFDEKTGCPVVINTSFNVRGEPIVCSPEEAYRCFMRTNIDYLAMGSFLIDKTGQEKAEPDGRWKKEFEPD